MAGFNPKAILAAIPGMLDLSKAGRTELAQTADIASNILTGFGLQADQMNRVGDVLVGTFTRGSVNLQMLGDTMKYVSPVAAGLGIDIETVAAMTDKLGDAGIQGSMAGTALRAVLSRLAAPPRMAADALAELNVKTKDAAGNLRPIVDILTELNEKTKKGVMGDADRTEFFKKIAGDEAMSGLTTLVKQAGSGGLQELIAALRASQGEAAANASTMADNAAGDIKTLRSAWEDVSITLFDSNNGPIRSLIQSITEIVRSVGLWMKENPQLTATLVKVAAVMAALVTVMGFLTLSAAAILGPIAIVRYSLAFLGVKGGLLTVILRGLGSAVMWLGRVFLVIGRALLLNPIGLAVTAIAGLAYLIYANWEPIKTFFTGIWSEIKQAASGGIAGISALILNWSPFGLFYAAWRTVLGWFGIELPARFSEFGANILRGLVGGITSALGAAKEAITGAGGAVIGWFKEKLGIRSPSRVFAELGGYITEGLAVGIAGNENSPIKRIGGLASRLAQVGAGVAIGAAALPAMAFDTRPPIQGQTAAPAASGGNHYEIHIHAAQGMDPQAIAQAVTAELDRRDRARAARTRSSLHDYD